MPPKTISSYTTYAASPLSHLLAETLKNIAAIKLKYSAANPKTTPEHQKKAAVLVNHTETLLKILHKDILPKFNNGEAPSLWSFIPSIPDLIKLRALKNKIYAQEKMLIAQISQQLYAIISRAEQAQGKNLTETINDHLEQGKETLFNSAPKKSHSELDVILQTMKIQISALNLEGYRTEAEAKTNTTAIFNHIIQHLNLELYTPHHPMTYELMETMVELINNAPENIVDIFTFFNPEIVPDMTSNGLIAGPLKKEAGIHKIVHLQNIETGPHSYFFELTKGELPTNGTKGVTTYVETRDLKAEYTEERSRLLNDIAVPTTRRYLAKYGVQHMKDMPVAEPVIQKGFNRIKSDVARLNILQTLASAERQSILTPVLALAATSEPFFKLNTTFSITDFEGLHLSYQNLRAALVRKRTSYESLTIDALLQTPDNTTIRATFVEHQNALLDVSYSQKPLPKVVICATEGLQAIGGPAIPIRDLLFSQIDTSLETLKEGLDFITHKIQALQTQSDKETADALYTATLKLINLEDIQQRLDEITKELVSLQERKGLLQVKLHATEAQCAFLRPTQTITSENVAQKQQELAELQGQLSERQQPIEQISTALITNAEAITLNLKRMRQNQHLLNLLPEISGILNADLKTTDKKPKISFKAIDEIINPNTPSTKAHNEFLRLVEAIDPDRISSWTNYCSRQEATFERNPPRHEFDLMINALLEGIKTKTTILTVQIQSNHEQDVDLKGQTKPLQEQLGRIADECRPISAKASLLEKELSLFNEITRLEEECRAVSSQLEGLATDEIGLVNHQKIPTELLGIIYVINSLKMAIGNASKATTSLVDQLKETHGLITKRINNVSIAINKVADVTFYQANLEAITQLLNPLGLKIDALSALAKQQQALESETLKKEQRKVLVNTSVSQLHEYRKTRAAKYNVKDFFNSTDKRKRHAFIEKLQQQLRDYDESGNNDEVLNSIRDNITRFPGKGLKPLLHGITIALIETKDTLSAIKGGLAAQHQAAQNILATFDPKKTPYAKTMNKLYEKIEFMERYGNKLTKNKDNSGKDVTELAEKLKEDRDRFINDHETKLPTKEKYNEFQEKFMARLHSKDNIMSKHSNKWGPIIGNIALLLLLIPKLIYSKVSTGQCSFFFETTKKNELINAIDKQARDLAPTIAPAC